MTTIDLNNAGKQQVFELIPNGTIATLEIKVRGGGAGPDGVLRRSKDGRSEGLDLELTVVEGPFAKRKLWTLLTLGGETQGHAASKSISEGVLKAVIESAHGILPDDKSPAACQRRQMNSYLDFDGLRFVAQIGVVPASNGYDSKNKIALVITPDMRGWTKPAQLDRPAASTPSLPISPPSSAGPVPQRPEWSR